MFLYLQIHQMQSTEAEEMAPMSTEQTFQLLFTASDYQ